MNHDTDFERLKKKHKLLKETANVLSVDSEHVLGTLKRFVRDVEEERKEIKRLKKL